MASHPSPSAVEADGARLCWLEVPCWDTDSYGRGLVSVSRTRTVPVAMVDRARLRLRARVSIRFALVELARWQGWGQKAS